MENRTSIAYNMKNLFGQTIYAELEKIKELYEVRLCINRKVVVVSRQGRQELNIVSTQEVMDGVIYAATQGSVYALSEKMKDGFINYRGGVRIGLGGEYAYSGGNVLCVRTVTSCVVRIPHEVRGCSSVLSEKTITKNILVVSPPMCGKTTFLRDIARRLSLCNRNVVVLDERGELSGGIDSPLDIGACDLLLGLPKARAYEGAIRALSPQHLIMDELFGKADVCAVREMQACGVSVAASIHADSLDKLPKELNFDLYVVLSQYPVMGSIKEVRYA